MKCKSCTQEDFKNPAEIVKHKKVCTGMVKPEVQVTPEKIATPFDVNAQIESHWNQTLMSPSPVVLVTSPSGEVHEPIQALPIPRVEESMLISNLQSLFNALKSPDGKATVGQLLADKDTQSKDPKQIFDFLIRKVMDGDERAIIRKYMS